MNWEIEDCLIRLENGMYEGNGRSPGRDRYTIEQHIRELESENKKQRQMLTDLLRQDQLRPT